jgi:hypothetical protein
MLRGWTWGRVAQEQYDSLCAASKPMGCRTPPGGAPAHTKVVAVDQPGGFSWWLGVRNVNPSAAGLTYQLTTSYTVTPCPSQCSANGECLRGRCYCNAGFVGEDCAMKEPTRYTALQFGARTPGYVGSSGWRYYYVNTDRSTSSLVVELELPKTGTHGAATAPVGFYLNRSDPPRESRSHKAVEVRPEQHAGAGETVTAVLSQEKPGSYSWWIGVQGSKLGGSSFTLLARSVRPCPRGCGAGHPSRGECDARTGRCFCRSGARGLDCSQSETPAAAHVAFGEPLLSHVAAPGWAFHALQVRRGGRSGLRRGLRGRVSRAGS